MVRLNSFSSCKENWADWNRSRIPAATLRSCRAAEGTKNELEIERNRLTIRLRRDFSEQKDRLAEAIVAFEETSQRLYESAGSMTVDETSNGPIFKFPMQGERSKGHQKHADLSAST